MTGEPTTQSERWRVGQTTLTSVVEEQTDRIPVELFFPAATADDVKRHPWLQPHYADADGNIRLRVQALVIEAGGRTIVADPCVGNNKVRSVPWWNEQDWPFMERFRAAGFDPARVDLVVHTHLHVDHVGWGTQLVDGEWRPTFPTARYLYVERELESVRASGDPDTRQIYADSIEPIVEAGLADTVDPDTDLGDGLRLAPTPGHTPGHVSLWIESDGEIALVTGDVIHHPVQLAEPTLRFVFDDDPDAAQATRSTLINDAAARPELLVVGTHFSTRPTGHIVTAGDAWRFDPVHGSP